MKRENRYKISYHTMFVILLLLALIVPSVAASAALEGTLTIQRFRVEDYANLQESTGQSSNTTDIPTNAESIAGVEFTVERLIVNQTDITVTPSTPIDTSFPARRQSTDANGETIFTGLPEGYYLVSESVLSGHSAQAGRFVVQIPHTLIDANGNESINYDVVVFPKGQSVQVEQRVSVSSNKQVVGIGDVVGWAAWYSIGADLKSEDTSAITLMSSDSMPSSYSMPNSDSGTSSYSRINSHGTPSSYGRQLKLSSEMDARFDVIEDSISLRYYDANEEEVALVLTQGVDYHLTLGHDVEAHTLTVAFTEVGIQKMADADVRFIQMHFDALVNTLARETTAALWSNVRILLENHLGETYEHEVFPAGTDIEDSRVPKVYLGQIGVTKVDASSKETLAGATFYLAGSKQEAESGNFLTRPIDANGNVEEITITTDENGRASIRAIGAGTYYLVETQAPEGYRKLTEPIEVIVADDARNNVVQVEVHNTKEGDSGKAAPEPDEPGKTGIAKAVKTGDVVRMTGIFLLILASVGMIVVHFQREKAKK